MPALCDVNVLLALVTDHHTLHGLAVHWADTVPADGAVLCRVAQVGWLRLLNNPAVMGEKVLDVAGCRSLGAVCSKTSDSDLRRRSLPVLTRHSSVSPSDELSVSVWTDAYLAAYAHAARLTLVTFDKGFRGFPGLTCNILAPESR